MKLTRCSNGHFYDGDVYRTCPHCEEANMGASGEDETVTTPINAGGIGPDISNLNVSDMPITVPINFVGSGTNGVTVPVNRETVPVTVGTNNAGVTMPTGGSFGPEEGVTYGLFDGIIKQSSSSNPIAASAPASPCVGWLVCIEGENTGRDYRLFEGRNTIGRADTNSIALSGDTSVSREAQAIIAYEPRGNKFFAVPGTARSNAYVNGQILLSQIELKKNDLLELGATKLMFIPCCDDAFNWNMVLEKNG